MYCYNCGKRIDDKPFCPNCGQKSFKHNNTSFQSKPLTQPLNHPSNIMPPMTAPYNQSIRSNYSNTGSSGTVCWIIGIIIGVIGIILLLLGNNYDGNYGNQLDHIIEYGSKDTTGSTMALLGIILAIAGGVLFIIGIILTVINKPTNQNR